MSKRRVRITGLNNEKASPALVGKIFQVRQSAEVISDEWWEEKHKLPIGTNFRIYYCYEKINGSWQHFAFYGKDAPETLQPNYSYEFLPDEEDKIV